MKAVGKIKFNENYCSAVISGLGRAFNESRVLRGLMQNYKTTKLLALFLFFLTTPTLSWAQANCGTLFPPNRRQADTSSVRPYRIYATPTSLAGMTEEEVRYSAILAFDTLSEQSGAAAFRYMGPSIRQLLPIPPSPPAQM